MKNMKLQTLSLTKAQRKKIETPVETSEKKFWKRQFQLNATKKQRIFDWTFGVILPVICFVADPIVFKGIGLGKGAVLGIFKPFAYLLNFALIMAMSAWLIWGTKLKWGNSFLAGLFLVGAIVSLAIGLVLSPFSLFGLLLIIGILGFAPFLTSFVYLRTSLRALNIAKPVFRKQTLIASFVLSVVLSFTIPMLVNLKSYRALEEMKTGNAETIRANADNLKYIAPLINFDEIGGKYCEEPDNERHTALAEVYQRYTGESIERIDFHICNDW